MKNEMIRKTKRLLLKPMSMEKPKTSWMTVYLCFGISIGMALGSLMGNIYIGMCYGVAAGVGDAPAYSRFASQTISTVTSPGETPEMRLA